ncbi:hypothetical protein GJ496_001431, partial [Pomphorhynchus laevis]
MSQDADYQNHEIYYALVGLADHHLSGDSYDCKKALRALLACLKIEYFSISQNEMNERKAFIYSSIGKMYLCIADSQQKMPLASSALDKTNSVEEKNSTVLQKAELYLDMAWKICTTINSNTCGDVTNIPLVSHDTGDNAFDTCLNFARLLKIYEKYEMSLSVLYKGLNLSTNSPRWHLKIACEIINNEIMCDNLERALEQIEYACNFCKDCAIKEELKCCCIMLTIFHSAISLHLLDYSVVSNKLNEAANLFEEFRGSQHVKHTLRALYLLVKTLFMLKQTSVDNVDPWLKRLQKIVQRLYALSCDTSQVDNSDTIVWMSPEQLAIITYL